MANPHYRLALEFLESVGTFRPKRELVKEIGAFKEQVVQLKDRCAREQLERRLGATIHASRLAVVRRREAVRAVLDGLVNRIEADAEIAEAARRESNAAARADAGEARHRRSEAAAALEGCVGALERRSRVAALAEWRACETCLQDVVDAVAAARDADAAARAGARATLDVLVGSVERAALFEALTDARRRARRAVFIFCVFLGPSPTSTARSSETVFVVSR